MTIQDDTPPEKKFHMTPAYELTFEELRERGTKGEAFSTIEGHGICSRDRKFNESKARYLWEADVANAIHQSKLPVGTHGKPDNIRPPKEATIKDTRPLNKKGRPFSWSFSAMNNFLGCPFRYAHEKFYCTVPWVESEAIKYGNSMHEAAENCLKGKPYDEVIAKPIRKYLELFKAKAPIAEMQIVLDQNMKPLTGPKAWFSKEAWFRAALDVVIINGGKAGYYDWKTGGKVKDDQDQLKTCLAALSIVKPELTEFTGKLIWTKHDTITGTSPAVLSKEDLQKVWADTLPVVKRMEDSWRTEVFNCRPSGLCKKWCAVKQCVHCGD